MATKWFKLTFCLWQCQSFHGDAGHHNSYEIDNSSHDSTDADAAIGRLSSIDGWY